MIQDIVLNNRLNDVVDGRDTLDAMSFMQLFSEYREVFVLSDIPHIGGSLQDEFKTWEPENLFDRFWDKIQEEIHRDRLIETILGNVRDDVHDGGSDSVQQILVGHYDNIDVETASVEDLEMWVLKNLYGLRNSGDEGQYDEVLENLIQTFAY